MTPDEMDVQDKSWTPDEMTPDEMDVQDKIWTSDEMTKSRVENAIERLCHGTSHN
jgi:hypothetical protein